MKIKVCGMRDEENISSLMALKPDFIGFIFYKKSKRFVTDFPQIQFPDSIKKVGVFVNEEIEEVVRKVINYNLDYVQLHGGETPEYIDKLLSSKDISIGIIKAFSVDETFDFGLTQPYENYCMYFIFDTKGTAYGGNGIKFNWEILQNYKGKTPFLLSGGISKKDANQIKKIKHPSFAGVDINSGFEMEPALKNINDIKEFKNNLL